MKAPLNWGCLWVLPYDELVWWLRVQAIYARSIGCSFAKAMNDNGRGIWIDGVEVFDAVNAGSR